MKALDIWWVVIAVLMTSSVGGMVGYLLASPPQPRFAVVDIQALIKQQTRAVMAQPLSDEDLKQKGKEKSMYLIKVIKQWAQKHHTILLHKSQCLTDLTDVTPHIQQVLEENK